MLRFERKKDRRDLNSRLSGWRAGAPLSFRGRASQNQMNASKISPLLGVKCYLTMMDGHGLTQDSPRAQQQRVAETVNKTTRRVC